jgi:hypothetical protein
MVTATATAGTATRTDEGTATRTATAGTGQQSCARRYFQGNESYLRGLAYPLHLA